MGWTYCLDGLVEVVFFVFCFPLVEFFLLGLKVCFQDPITTHHHYHQKLELTLKCVAI